MARILAWVISIVLVVAAFWLPRRLLEFMMWLALAVATAWTLALFTL